MQKEKHMARIDSGRRRLNATGSGSISRQDENAIRQRMEKTAGKRREAREFRIEQNIKAQHNKERAMSPGYVLLLLALSLCIFIAAMRVVWQHSVMNEIMTDYNRMTSEYEKMVAQNDELEAIIRAEIDVDRILLTAQETLHMSYPAKSQVITYKKTEKEQVIQNVEIPE